ncbi:MAG TPA: GNAT family protein [Acidiferrobacterales bacterium]|nr:GNAT family protein [Acidiferrobacterales bacterium]
MAPVSASGFEAIGFSLDGGQLIGGVVYTSYYRLADGTGDISLTAAGAPGWLTKATLRVIFGYPFRQISCSRVTALTSKPNRRSRDLLERLGFVHEGTIRGAFGCGRDGILYGMIREQCKWIR